MSEDKKNHVCDCEHEHDCDCDCGCDMDEGVIMLEDEEGNEVPFYHVATLEHEGKEYACLQKADDEDPLLEIFELADDEEGDEDFVSLLPIDDDLYEVLYNKLEAEIAAETDDECDDPDCDCHCHDDK